MLGEILRFLLEIVFTLFGAALIARAWMHAIRLPPFNPLARAIYQATNWLVLPLRKIIPAGNKIDWTSRWRPAVGAGLSGADLAGGHRRADPRSPAARRHGFGADHGDQVGAQPDRLADADPAVLSWVNPMAPLMPLLSTLTAPLLDPIRRILPRSSIDFSPLVLLVVAQIVLMVLARLSYSLMGCRSHPEALRAFPRAQLRTGGAGSALPGLGRQCCLGRCVLKETTA